MQRFPVRSMQAIALSSVMLCCTTGYAASAKQQTQLVPAQAQVLPAPEASAPAEPQAPPSRLVPINRPQPSARATVRRGAPLTTIRSANDLSRQTPAPDGFINSAMFYDYMPGAIYEVHTSPRFISTIALRPGEKLISKAAGDTVRWVMGETQQGTGSNAQTLVFVKPIKGELRTNIVLTTDQRTYMLEAISHNSDAYTSIVSWNYPRDQLAELSTAGILADGGQGGGAIDGDISVDNLNFAYRIKPVKPRGRAPAWMPERVFDDGHKTYIQFAPDLGTTEAPPLFVIGENKQAELVNYRVQGRYYVVDRLITAAELRLGTKEQQIVRIERKRDRRS
jgi:P-type conjugative transfer protein TrbG